VKAAVYYHPDFADYGYTTLKHRVRPGFDALQGLIRAARVQVYKPIIDGEARELLELTHHPDHIARVIASGYHQVALLSAAGVIQAAELMASGRLDFAFCFTGTAGHHAGYNYCWGFCYYNDAALAVKKLRREGIKRIMIMDIDPHSGDGTRDLLADDLDVIHINFFADEEYGYSEEKRGNYGILIDGAGDQIFLQAVDEYISREWDFEFLIIIFGHDGHGLDYGDFYLDRKSVV
jgi:acetoin utilization deacetylase AcuC-like enzyme